MILKNVTNLEAILDRIANKTGIKSTEKVYRNVLDDYKHGVITISGKRGMVEVYL